jgi:aminoglycoside phosphotransferase (APT) family kinase protein
LESRAQEDRVHALLERRWPGFAELRSVERLSGGASQETYRIVFATRDGEERRLALRRAAGGMEREGPGPGLSNEARLMRVAREAGVPEPEVHHVLEPEDGLGPGFLMEWLEGEALGARIARAPELEEVRPRLARQCGEILARIHAIDLEKSGLVDVLATVTPEQYVRMTWEGYRAYATPQPMIDYTARWLLDHLPADAELRLVHNDFRNGNLLIGPEGVVAVLDWELAHIGDPMRDLGWLCTNSWRFGRRELPVGGFGERADLFGGYEAVSGRRSVERPAIGRRSSECQVDCVNLLIPGNVALAEANAAANATDMPRADELLQSVRDFLRGEVMEGTRGRTRFLARVAANSLDIVGRELSLAPAARERELSGLRALFECDDDLTTLRWRLVTELREGSMPLDRPGLAEVLREAVVHQAAIDQPRYSGFRHAIGGD